MLENKEGYYPTQAGVAQVNRFHLKQVHSVFSFTNASSDAGLTLNRARQNVPLKVEWGSSPLHVPPWSGTPEGRPVRTTKNIPFNENNLSPRHQSD